MITQEYHKIRVLWVTEKEFDFQPNKAPYIEMITCLQESCVIQLLSGYRYKRIQPQVFHNRVVYYRSAKTPYVKRFTRSISAFCVFHSMLKSFRPNIVLFHNCDDLILLRYALLKRVKHNLRLIFDVRTLMPSKKTLRCWIDSKLFASCLRYAAEHFDGITYITEQMKQYCIDRYRLHPHSSIIWTSGVNPALFCPSRMTSSSGPFTILYHGAVSKQRKIDNAIKAISLLKDIDIRLVLLGNADGLADLKKLVDNLGVKNRVSFKEMVSYEEVSKWINCCDAGILPFQSCDIWNTSSPIKLFEYLACGKPIIVTDIPAHRNVLGDSDFAFWAKQSSPQDIAFAIRQAYCKRKEFEHFSLEARKLVLEKYTWAKQAEKLRRFFDFVLSNNRVGHL